MNKDEYYFQNLSASMDCCIQSACLLKKVTHKYQAQALCRRVNEMLELEQKVRRHHDELIETVSHAFITPIEREDLIVLSDGLRRIMDASYRMLQLLSASSIASIRREIYPIMDNFTECTDALKDLIWKICDIRHSTDIYVSVTKVYLLRQQAYARYLENQKQLYQEKNISDMIKWISLYEQMDQCMEACDEFASLAVHIIIKNS